MRKHLHWIGLVMLVALAACSSSEPKALDFVDYMDPDVSSVPVSGAAVDDGIVCEQGTLDRIRMEDMDGNLVSEEESVANWDAALNSGAVLDVMLHDEFSCSDGSGSFTIVTHNVVQPSVLDFAAANDVGTWKIDGGTGAYEKLIGEGTLIADFGRGEAHYSGELTSW